jgi:signal transduction histidine kinase
MNSFEHYLRELQQIQSIEKKLAQKLETRHDLDKPETINEMVDNLDHVSDFTTSLTETLSTKETVERKLLTKLNHELRTPLVPIHAYTDMLLSEKFGKLSDEQTKRLGLVSSNIKKLEEVITNLLNEKQFNVIESEKKDQPNSSQVIKELEQKKMILGRWLKIKTRRLKQILIP